MSLNCLTHPIPIASLPMSDSFEFLSISTKDNQLLKYRISKEIHSPKSKDMINDYLKELADRFTLEDVKRILLLNNWKYDKGIFTGPISNPTIDLRKPLKFSFPLTLTEQEKSLIYNNRTFVVTSRLRGNEEPISIRVKEKGLVWAIQLRKENEMDHFLGRLKIDHKEIVEEVWFNKFSGIEHFNEPQLERLKAAIRIKTRLVAADGKDRIITA